MKRIYFDHSATTPIDKIVISVVNEAMERYWGNASSVHGFGREAKARLEDAREVIAKSLGANSDEIYFTSGGTEADNLALFGLAEIYKDKKRHLITSAIEHHAVLDSAEYLKSNGFDLTMVGVDSEGIINPDDIRNAITPDTFLVSVHHVNNELGTIQPISEIGAICREKGVLFHTDAVQSFGKIPVNVKDMHLDLLSLSSHKIYGPKGIGALYVRRGVKLKPRTHGGGQERKLRTGTENLPGILGLVKAVQICQQEKDEEAIRLKGFRDRLYQGIKERIPDIKLNGHPEKRLPGLLNLSFPDLEGESLLLSMDLQGIAASTGSACSSGSVDPSHVLLGIGLNRELAQSTIRFSLGRANDAEDIDRAIEIIPPIVEKLRAMAPAWTK
jgi:cysteine desulfurase